MADFSILHECIEGPDNFFHWRERVPCVHPVKIDVIGLKTPQRSFNRAVDALPSVPACVRVARLRVERKFCGQDDPVPCLSFLDELPDQLLAFSVCIPVRSVYKIASSFQVTVKNCARRGLVCAPAPFRAKRHRSQAKRADPQTRSAQRYVLIEFHRKSPPFAVIITIASLIGCHTCPGVTQQVKGLADQRPSSENGNGRSSEVEFQRQLNYAGFS